MSDFKSDIIKLIRSKSSSEQLVIGCEECSELIKAITKIYRYGLTKENRKNLIEEMADVYIMLNILSEMFEIGNIKFSLEVATKMKRNLDRIK